MKIYRMRATFGPLENEALELADGLNIVTANNESGKSTWCAFIRAMLYGVDSSAREKAGAPKPDKIKYAPWSGSAMEGSMDIQWNGRDITLTRRTKTASAPMREFSAVYTGTSEPVPGLDGRAAGETITGVPRAVFERSAFISQSGMAVSRSPELSDRIAAIVSTGDEETSYADADDRLRAWARKRRYNKRGRLPELENEMRQKRAALDSLQSAAADKQALARELAVTEKERAALFTQVSESRRLQRKNALAQLNRAKQELRELESAAESARALESEKRVAVDQSIFSGAEPDSIAESAMADAAEARRCDALSDRILSPLIWVIPAVLTVIAAVLGIVVSPWVFIPAAVLAVISILNLVRAAKFKSNAIDCELKRAGILSRYGADTEDDIEVMLSDYEDAYAQWQSAKEASRKASILLDNARAKQSDSDAMLLSALDFSGGNSEAARLSRTLNATDERLRLLREAAARADGVLKTMGDEAQLRSELKALEDEYALVSQELEALELAISVLGDANTEIQTRFSPRLGKLASQYMQRLTGGRYKELLMDRDMRAQARLASDAVAHDSGFLSEGAENQLYLALRLAIVRLALPDEERCPIVLDDALVSFDAERLGLALELLRELSDQRQIILFTCHLREAEYFAGDDSVSKTMLV